MAFESCFKCENNLPHSYCEWCGRDEHESFVDFRADLSAYVCGPCWDSYRTDYWLNSGVALGL